MGGNLENVGESPYFIYCGRYSKTTKISSLKTSDENTKVTNEMDIAEIGPSLSDNMNNTDIQFSDYIFSQLRVNFILLKFLPKLCTKL